LTWRDRLSNLTVALPATPTPRVVTDLLLAWGQGVEGAREKLVPLVYDRRLVEQRRARWENRAQFFAVASQLMRRILVDHAREHGAAKRGGGRWRVELEEGLATTGPRELDMVALDEALEELAHFDERQVRIVEMRFSAGFPSRKPPRRSASQRPR
jgi:RNA polymerase sigma-70 factor, ECF subfamily